MPKHKSKKRDSSSDSDSGPEDKSPMKKPKSDEKKKSKDDDDSGWSLGKNRFVKLREFKGTWYLDIREYYNSDGELKPGKKGIMLSMEQFQKFKSSMEDIEEAIKQNV